MKFLRKIVWLALISLVVSTAWSQIQTHQYREREDAIANPLKGWVIWGENYTTPPQPTTLFFSYRSWRKLEPVEGRFEFEQWENDVWQPWTQRGMKVIFRVYADYPGRPIGIPPWLIDAGVTLTKYDDYGGGWSPDYDHPLFLEKVQRLIAALGERYDNDPRVAFLDVGVLGHWGEWHTYPRTELFASVRVQREIMKGFLTAFPTKKMMLRTPSSWSAQLAFGYRDDCFLTDTDGPEDWKFFNLFRSARAEDVWKTQPIGGEFCGGGEGAKTGTLNQPDECLRLIEEGHFSHLGPAGGSIVAENDAHQRHVDAMLKKMGYRFVIRDATFPLRVESGKPFVFQFTIENVGSAPFYYPWTLQIILRDLPRQETIVKNTEIDVTKWLPGQHGVNLQMIAPPVVEETTFHLGLSIGEPVEDGARIRFTNVGNEENGVFYVGEFNVTSAANLRDWNEY
jgi:hypothetical protein